MVGLEPTSRNDELGLGTDCSGGATPGYTAVVLSTPVRVVVPMVAWMSVFEVSWTIGTTRPETDEKAKKAARAWKCILFLRLQGAWVVFKYVNERATNQVNDCFLQAQ